MFFPVGSIHLQIRIPIHTREIIALQSKMLNRIDRQHVIWYKLIKKTVSEDDGGKPFGSDITFDGFVLTAMHGEQEKPAFISRKG